MAEVGARFEKGGAVLQEPAYAADSF